MLAVATRYGEVMQQLFARLDVSAWREGREEPVGREEKAWLVDEAGVSWLFKPVTQHETRDQGEDWAEKLTSELAAMVGVPAATVELAVRNGVPGCISRDLRPEAWEMQTGFVLLSQRDIGYADRRKTRGRPGHSLNAVRNALEGFLAPPDAEVPAGFDAFDVFVGYLLFDAWIANRDRHDENWSVLLAFPPKEPGRLAGSYDHAGSLGYNLTDGERQHRLQRAGGVAAWCERGTAWRFEHDPRHSPPTLVHLAARALSLVEPEVRAHWLAGVASVTDQRVAAVVDRIPNLSDPTRTFARKVLSINRRRVLDECGWRRA